MSALLAMLAAIAVLGGAALALTTSPVPAQAGTFHDHADRNALGWIATLRSRCRCLGTWANRVGLSPKAKSRPVGAFVALAAWPMLVVPGPIGPRARPATSAWHPVLGIQGIPGSLCVDPANP
jgi:hypothetical protein